MLLLMVLPINGSDSKVNNTYVFKIRADYFFHVLMLLPWMFLKPKERLFEKPFVWFIVGIGVGLGMEFVQQALPYRAFNINDAISNVSGVVLGYFIFSINKKFVKSEKINN